MAKDTLRWQSLILIISFVTKISSSTVQPSLTEYLLASLGPQGAIASQSLPPAPRPSYQNTYGPNYQNYQTPPVYANPPKPSSTLSGSLPSPLTAIANLATAIPVSDSKLKTPSIPKTSDVPSATFDSNVLNNLAIALQLLIVSNILNTPAENLSQSKYDTPKFDSTPKFETLPISPLTLSYPLKSSPLQTLSLEPPRSLYSNENPPNSKFISSSGFVEPSMFGSAFSSVGPKPSPRSSLTLMSPYEALGPNSPYSDPVLSSIYGSSYPKNGLQSPYASILAADGHKDLFSFTDLF